MKSIKIEKRKVTQGSISFDSHRYSNQRLRGGEGLDVDIEIYKDKLLVYNSVGNYVCEFTRNGIIEI